MINYSLQNFSPYNIYRNYESNSPTIVTSTVDNSNVTKKNNEKGLSTEAKWTIGIGVTTAFAIGADFLFCKGKHIKSILGKGSKSKGSKGSASNIGNNANTQKSSGNSGVTTPPKTPSKSENTSQINVPNGSQVSVNANSNISVNDMRAYIQKKYNTGIDYNRTPCCNYSEAIFKNYLGIRTCPADYYQMTKSYDANKLFDISSKGGNGIHVDDNDGIGWFYRFATKNLKSGQKQTKVIDRISLNVYPDEGLIKALDDFIKHTNVNVEYKVPQNFSDWTRRHDPITMYFRETIPQSAKEEIIKIVTPYVRTPKGEVMIGTKLANGIYQIPNPTEQDVLNLIKRAEKLGDDKLVECLKSEDNPLTSAGLFTYSKSAGRVIVKASAGQLRAVEMLIADLEKFKANSSL